MSLEVVRPICLIVLLGLAPVVYFFVTSEAFIPRWRRWTSLVLRIVFILLLAFALAELRLVRRNEQLAVVFAVDVSDSIEPSQREQVMASLDEAAANMTDKEVAATIT